MVSTSLQVGFRRMYLFCLLTSMFAPQMYHAAGAVSKDGPSGTTGRSCVFFGAPRKKTATAKPGRKVHKLYVEGAIAFWAIARWAKCYEFHPLAFQCVT